MYLVQCVIEGGEVVDSLEKWHRYIGTLIILEGDREGERGRERGREGGREVVRKC